MLVFSLVECSPEQIICMLRYDKAEPSQYNERRFPAVQPYKPKQAPMPPAIVC